MAGFIQAIMALGHGAAAAATGAAGTAGAAGGAAAGAGAGTAAGTGLAGASTGAAGTVGAAMPAAGSVATKAPSLIDKADAFMNRPSVGTAQKIGGDIFKGAGQSSPVPNEQSGAPVENPIAPSPSFPGGDSAMPQALMPGAMDIPFGAPSQRALNDTLLRNGG